MRVSPDMDLAPLRLRLGEASDLDAAALRSVLVAMRIEDLDRMDPAEWHLAVRAAYRRLPSYLRPEI